MIKTIATLAVLAVLTACGADGEPKKPAPKPGVSITGQVQVGVAGGN